MKQVAAWFLILCLYVLSLADGRLSLDNNEGDQEGRPGSPGQKGRPGSPGQEGRPGSPGQEARPGSAGHEGNSRMDGFTRRWGCEGAELTLGCTIGSGLVIHIKSAVYGLPPKPFCGRREGSMDIQQCSTKALQIVEELCSNKTSCKIPIDKETFGNTCGDDVITFLDVQQDCQLPGRVRMSTTFAPLPSRLSPTMSTEEGVHCPFTERRDIVWHPTAVGHSALEPCPNNPQVLARWECVLREGMGVWWGEPDLSNCLSPFIDKLKIEINLSREKFNGSAIREVANTVNRHTREHRLYGGDLNSLGLILYDMVTLLEAKVVDGSTVSDVKTLVGEVTQAMVEVSSNLLGAGESWRDLPSSQWTGNASRLLRTVEKSSFLLAGSTESSLGNTDRLTDNIALSVGSLKSMAGDELVFPRLNQFSASMPWRNNSNSLSLSRKAIDNIAQTDKESNVVFLMYRNIATWLQPSTKWHTNESQACLDNGSCSQAMVNSDIVSASIQDSTQRLRLNGSKVHITLRHYQIENVSSPVCVFWEFGHDFSQGDWSNEGCTLVSTNETHSICACDHLTNFAIIMSPTQPNISAANQFALTAITYFGCIISIICLLLAFITFTVFKNLQCDRNTIHKNLCLCLLIGNTVFICGIMLYSTPVLCSIVAAILQYIFLASFAWMLLEGVQLYVMLVEIFESEKSRIKWYYLGAYGFPAVIVASSAAIYHEGYGTPTHCWLSTDRGFVWSFLAPVICVISVNFVMLGVAINAMLQHAKSVAAMKMKEKSKLQQLKMWLKGTIVLVFLLGLTWLFGLLYISADTVVFAYIFAILNSLQGTFIFIFHCLLNEKVQIEYRKVIRRTSWLPESFRTKYGGASSGVGSNVSSSPNRSHSGSKPFSSLLGKKRRKSSQSTTLSSSSHNRRKGNEDGVGGPTSLLSAPVDSGIEDPSSYNEPARSQFAESEFYPPDSSIIEGSIADTDYIDRLTTKESSSKSPIETSLTLEVSAEPSDRPASSGESTEPSGLDNERVGSSERDSGLGGQTSPDEELQKRVTRLSSVTSV